MSEMPPEDTPEPQDAGTGPSMPADPFDGTQIPLLALHQAYLSLCQSGFASLEALFYLAANTSLQAVIAAQQAPPPEQP